MAIAFVLGNGLSRQGIDLARLNTRGKIYGCNALYREYAPDVLVATDKPIATAIQESGYSSTHKFYTRKPIPRLGGLPIPKDYHGFSSGPAATAIAALDSNKKIYLIGFDMGPTTDNLINNVYAGTEFYKPKNALPIYTGNWIKQLKTILTGFPDTKFIRVIGNLSARIPELEGFSNMDQCDLSALIDRINNIEDL